MTNYKLNEKTTIVLLIVGSDIGKLETNPVDLSKLLKRLSMMNYLKKLMLFKPLIKVIELKNL